MAKILLPFLTRGVTQVAWVVEDLDKAVEMHYRFFGIGSLALSTVTIVRCSQ